MTIQQLRLTLHATGLKHVAGAFKGTPDLYAEVKLLVSGSDEQPETLSRIRYRFYLTIALGRMRSLKSQLLIRSSRAEMSSLDVRFFMHMQQNQVSRLLRVPSAP